MELNDAMKNALDKKEKELLNQLKEVSKPANFLTLKLEYNNNVVLAKKDFMADTFSLEAIEKTQLHFMIVDFVRELQEEIRKQQNELDEIKKKEQMDKLWDQNEKQNKT